MRKETYDRNVRSKLAKNCRRLRGKESLTAVAKRCQVPVSAYWEIEQGGRMPGFGFALRLATAFGVPVDSLSK